MRLDHIAYIVSALAAVLIVLQVVAQSRSDERKRAAEADEPYARFYQERARESA